MVTYVNDLRLSELATGEGSGTWGTTTNTNLELIGEALGYGTEQSFSSDADATTTIGDGVSDPARAMYFKVTSAGSLTATRTLTIAPNTVSRVMFIENATTGSQSIAISQGSGASVTILTGKTAVVYLDGAGATAAVVDAMSGVDPGVTDTLTEVLVAGNTSGGTNIELSTTDKVQFRDAAIYLNSSVDGQLDIVADTEIQIAATTVDLNGNLDVSGTALVTGVLTTTAATVFNGGFASNADSTLGTDKKVQFRDAAIYINSSVDGQLDIVADTEIQIAATTIDINGAINASGEIIAASLDISGDVDIDGTTNLDVVDIDGAVDMASTLTVGSTISINEPTQTTYGLVSKVKSVYLSSTDATYANLTIRKEAATSTDYLQIRDSGNALLANLTSLGGLITAPTAGGHTIFNEGGVDADFRVESDTNANMLLC
jgi:cytoskeletal protein CcmA (bactofilin family)